MKLLISAIFLTALCIPVFGQDENVLNPEYGEYGKLHKYHIKHLELPFSTLKADKEKYEHKKVFYEAPYINFKNSFPRYAEDSGFSSKKHIIIIFGSAQVPVIAKKSTKLVEVLGKLKKGMTVLVYGRVKEFRSKPRRSSYPRYYVELTHLTVLKTKTPREEKAEQKKEKRRQRRKRRQGLLAE